MSTLSYPRHQRHELALPARLGLASTLSLAIAALAVAVSAAGLFADLYRDNACAWVAQPLAFALNGTVPTILKDTGSPTSIVFALDLTLVVPTLVVAAALLWRRRPWGYLLATILMVKSVGYATALLAMSAFQATSSGARIFYTVIAVLAVAVAVELLAVARALPRRVHIPAFKRLVWGLAAVLLIGGVARTAYAPAIGVVALVLGLLFAEVAFASSAETTPIIRRGQR